MQNNPDVVFNPHRQRTEHVFDINVDISKITPDGDPTKKPCDTFTRKFTQKESHQCYELKK